MPPLLRFFVHTSLGLTAFLFIAQQLPLLTWLHWPITNTPFYLFLTLLGGISFYDLVRNYHAKWELFFQKFFLTFLPSILCFSLGISLSREFHYIVFLSVGGYLILLFGFLAWKRICSHQSVSLHSSIKLFTPFQKDGKINKHVIVSVIFIALLFLSFGLQNLGRFAAVDEPLWLDGRIGKFWKNLGEQKMDKTLVSDKPGITIALASGPGLFFVEAKEYRDTRAEFQKKNPDAHIEDFYTAFRLPLLLVITTLLPFFYLLLVPLTGHLIALFSLSAIAFSPILIGMSKIVNPDSLLWVFAPLTFLSYLIFLEKKHWRFLFLSGFLLGLALLTKYVANILIVYCFSLCFLYPLWQEKEKFTVETLRTSLQAFLIWISIGLATLYLLLPAFWVEPKLLLTSTLFSQAFEKVAWLFMGIILLIFSDQWLSRGRLSQFLLTILNRFARPLTLFCLGLFTLTTLFVFIHSLFGMPWLNFMELLASPKSSYKLSNLLSIFLSHFYPLIFGIHPLLLIGTLITTVRLWLLPRNHFTATDRLGLSILAFIFLYYLGSTVNQVVLVSRYQIMLYPLVAILGIIGLHVLFKKFETSSFGKHFSPKQYTLIGGIILFGCLIISPLTTTFPLSYASLLLPRSQSLDVKDMGTGSYEAAQFLNNLPQAEELTVWTDKGGVCKFFVGTCLDGLTFEKLKLHQIDYVILSSSREMRLERWFSNPFLLNDDGLIRFDEYYDREDPVYHLQINGRKSHWIKIFPLNPSSPS